MLIDKRAKAIFYFILVSISAFSQNFGGFPPTFKWQTINEPEVRVIFPKGLEGQAQRLVNAIKYMDQNNRTSIGEKRHKINITLQNQGVISNGFVQLAPFKSEFFTNPLQESGALGSLPWLDLLAIHEYRHVLQFTNGRRGFSKFSYFLFGEYGWAVTNNLAVPNWFWEGDAVVTETALSEQGRGRLPSFQNPFRSLKLAKTKYNYMKLRNGSLRSYVPNHYNLGYLMCVYGRETYGNDFWKKVFSDATSYSGVVYPFSRAIYRHSGGSVGSRKLYKQSLIYFNKKWQQELDTLKITKANLVNTLPKGKTVTTYEYPYFVDNEKIIALKSSFKQIPTFSLIDSNGEETALKVQGFTTDNYFDFKNNTIVWSELRFDARWSNFDYSVLKVFDINTKISQTLTTKSKYFSPSLSQNAEKIVAVEQNTNQEYTLHILDAKNGMIEKVLPNPDNLFFTYPKFSIDNQYIISSVRNLKGEMALAKQSISTGEIEWLVGFSNNVLGVNYSTKDYVFFEASYSGIDNIYAVQFGNQQVYQITSREIGNYQPAISPDGKRMVFSQFSNKGNQLFSVNLDSVGFRLFSKVSLSKQTKFDFEAIRAEGGDILNKVPKDSFNVEKYNQVGKLLNFHSWIPIITHPNYGLSFYSDNILNNLSASLSGSYNVNESSFNSAGNISYGGLFPILQLGAFNNGDRKIVYDVNNGPFSKGKDSLLLSEVGGNVGFNIPLNLTKGVFSRYLNFSSQFYVAEVTRKYLDYNVLTSKLNYDLVTSTVNKNLGVGFVFLNSKRKARQNIFSSFGQYVSLDYKRSLSFSNVSQIHGICELSFRGLHPNHNLVVEGGYLLDNNNSNYRFTNNFYYPRGYRTVPSNTNEMFRIGVNYHFPIAYPDFGIAGILYILRIRGNVFCDAGFITADANLFPGLFDKTKQGYSPANSIGGELIFDLNLFNALPFTLGVRYSFVDNKNYVYQPFEFIVPIIRL